MKKLDDEEDCKEILYSLLYNGTLGDEDKKNILSRIHIPVGSRIFDFKNEFCKEEQLTQRKKELKEKLESIVN
jgi:hypothetical protein